MCCGYSHDWWCMSPSEQCSLCPHAGKGTFLFPQHSESSTCIHRATSPSIQPTWGCGLGGSSEESIWQSRGNERGISHREMVLWGIGELLGATKEVLAHLARDLLGWYQRERTQRQNINYEKKASRKARESSLNKITIDWASLFPVLKSLCKSRVCFEPITLFPKETGARLTWK